MNAQTARDHTAATPHAIAAGEVAALMIARLSDGLDHPELWADMPVFVAEVPGLAEAIGQLCAAGCAEAGILRAMVMAAAGDVAGGLASLEPLSLANSQSALVQGAVFHLQSLLDPANPKFALADKVCPFPFEVLDVLDGQTHQCCASWLHQSAGDLAQKPWREVWNSPEAQAVRASMLDGSYRFCNKVACHYIGANELPTRAELAERSPWWRDVLEHNRTEMDRGPRRVNLAYDQSCNLSCPSCRTHKFAADGAMRDRFARLQEEAILPMLKDAEIVWVTGSGDAFASKNFRQLLADLTPEAYPDLRFQIMTNGMLLTRAEWARFPSLHGGRVAILRLSLDAATGPTHEAIRRGARWPVMLENMSFFSELRREGEIGTYDIIFTVQTDNFHEMADAIDLALAQGADHVWFYRLTNWGTFADAEYAEKAVFSPSHPRHGEFLAMMRDPRLRHPIARLGDFSDFAAD